MSISTVGIILTRIKVATPKSPIAVFKPLYSTGDALHAVFGATITTHRRVANGDARFVGYFHNELDADSVYKALWGAARG